MMMILNRNQSIPESVVLVRCRHLHDPPTPMTIHLCFEKVKPELLR